MKCDSRGLRWRVILSISQVALASALLVLAQAQISADEAKARATAARIRGHVETGTIQVDIISIWDHYVPAAIASAAVNFPAIVISAPLLALFRDEPVVVKGFYLIAVAVFWFWVGLQIDLRRGTKEPKWKGPPSRLVRAILGAGFLLALVFGLVAIRYAIWGDLFPLRLLSAAILVWSIAFTSFFGRRLRSGSDGANTTVGE